MKRRNPITIFMVLLFLAGAYFPFFLHLDKLTIRPWDEARNAVNAIEMADNGSWIAPTFDGHPENWNTKPPLLFWMQSGLMKIIGFNELAVRLPSAMAGLAICLMLLFWVGKLGDSRPAGWLAGVVMMTVTGFFHWHGARQGDFDTVLLCFMLFYSIAFFQFLHGPADSRNRNLLLFVLGVFLAVFTKAVAGFFLLPGLFVYALISGKLGFVLRQKRLYWYGLAFIIVLGSYLGSREMMVPGFLKALNHHELMGRFFAVTENSPGPFFMYLENWWETRFDPWNIWLIVGWVGLLIFGNPLRKKLGFFSLVVGSTYILMVSFSKTKMLWYDLPTYPFAAIIIGLGIVSILEKALEVIFSLKILNSGAKERDGLLSKIKISLIWLMLLVLAFAPYKNIIDKVYFPVEDGNEREQFGHFIHYLSQNHPELQKYTAVNKEYNAGLLFYRHQARIEHQVIVDKKMVNKHTFEPGEMVFTCYQDLFQEIKDNYDLSEIDSKTYSIAFNNRICTCTLFKINFPLPAKTLPLKQ